MGGINSICQLVLFLHGSLQLSKWTNGLSTARSDSSQLSWTEQSCKSTQLNCRKMTSFFCRLIELKATHVIWTVDTLTSQLSSSELAGVLSYEVLFLVANMGGLT